MNTKNEIEIKDIGKNVIDLQIKALKKLKYSLNNSFDKAVKKILKCKSKVILCGVGKSQIISEKISATLVCKILHFLFQLTKVMEEWVD